MTWKVKWSIIVSRDVSTTLVSAFIYLILSNTCTNTPQHFFFFFFTFFGGTEWTCQTWHFLLEMLQRFLHSENAMNLIKITLCFFFPHSVLIKPRALSKCFSNLRPLLCSAWSLSHTRLRPRSPQLAQGRWGEGWGVKANGGGLAKVTVTTTNVGLYILDRERKDCWLKSSPDLRRILIWKNGSWSKQRSFTNRFSPICFLRPPLTVLFSNPHSFLLEDQIATESINLTIWYCWILCTCVWHRLELLMVLL